MNMKNKLHIADEEIIPLLEGLLEPEEEEKLWEHIDKCLYCARRVRRMTEALKKADSIKGPSYEEIREFIQQKEKTYTWKQRIIYWIESFLFPYSWKLPVGGLVAVLLFIIIISVWKGFYSPELYTKKTDIRIEFNSVKNPILIHINDTNKAIYKLTKLVEIHNGKILQVLFLKEGVRVIIEVKDIEKFLKDLNKIGKPLIPEYGYKDSKGNIVILLKKKLKDK